MKFKSDRLQVEWGELVTKNTRLHTLVSCLDLFVDVEFKKELVVTCIFRTEAENKELYKDVPNPPATSPHMYWGAVDIRSSVFTDTEIQRMLKFLNCFLYKGGAKPTAIYHTIAGNTWHFHIQG